MASILRSVATTTAVVAAASAIPIAIAFSSSSSSSSSSSANPKSQCLNFSFLNRSSPRPLGLSRSFASSPMTTVPASDRKPLQEDRVLPQLLSEFMVDMKCEGCVNAVKNKLETIEGIENVEVDLPNQVVRILGSSPVMAMTQPGEMKMSWSLMPLQMVS
ncbi:unnamed protein product [Microthlaspi erraticum]|uniref:HMA domain-containing protein n=1 Tax=Microthlaspi erraticum TaxID=1685480 RepID=A0A6D2J7M2_9BRAS|nr:unnamed protein product [Microthlaspi erraticum]